MAELMLFLCGGKKIDDRYDGNGIGSEDEGNDGGARATFVMVAVASEAVVVT